MLIIVMDFAIANACVRVLRLRDDSHREMPHKHSTIDV